MTLPISIEKKRTFLNWFIYHHKVKAHDMDWFLSDLLENNHALNNLHFVDDITDCPKGIIITTYLNEQINFTFFKGKVKTDNVYTAYHEMHLYNEEPLYIQVNFPFCTHNELYQAVIIDSKLVKDDIKDRAEKILNQTLRQDRHKFLKAQINDALEAHNYDLFMYYSSQLKQMQ